MTDADAEVWIETPGWDTKQRCSCGEEFPSRCQFWKHQADAYIAAHDARVKP